jgi:acetyl-CoA carboxylase beta subunit
MSVLVGKKQMDDPLVKCPYCSAIPYAYRFRDEWHVYPSCFCHGKAEDMERVRNEYLNDHTRRISNALDKSEG